MNESSIHPDDLVTLTTRPTEFEAHAAVAVLADAGIEAFAFGAAHALLPLGERLVPVPVQVRQRDLERARAALQQSVADSVDLDWDEVDVGERVDDLPLTSREGMPVFAKVGLVVALLILISIVVGGIFRSANLLP